MVDSTQGRLEFPTKFVEEPRFNRIKSYGGTCTTTFSKDTRTTTGIRIINRISNHYQIYPKVTLLFKRLN
jgi:hypothetical protein